MHAISCSRISFFVMFIIFSLFLFPTFYFNFFYLWRPDNLGAIHSTKISGNFGPKLNGSVRSNRKSFEKTGPPFEVVHFSRSDRLEFWLNGSRPLSPVSHQPLPATRHPPPAEKSCRNQRLACENSLALRRWGRFAWRNVLSGEERGETAVSQANQR